MAQFQAIQTSSGTSFAGLFSSIAALSTAEFDSQPFDVSAIGDRAVVITQDISRVLTSQLATARKRIDAVNTQLTAAASAGLPADQVTALTAAAKALFGDDFQIIPEFAISTAQGTEWANAVNASNSGDPFTYVKNTLNIDFPVDEWFYGAARVRAPLRYWESALMLANAFGLTPPAADANTAALRSGRTVAGPANSRPPTPSTATACSTLACIRRLLIRMFGSAALLLDEWTEVIPATTRDTALTFNYARPDNEPPQTMLLVTSASNTGTWQWEDLVGALNETLDLAKKRARRTRHARPDGLLSLPASDRDGEHQLRHHHRDRAHRRQRRYESPSRRIQCLAP